MNPILDGQPVDPSLVDPAKHRFIGTFRPASKQDCQPIEGEFPTKLCPSCGGRFAPYYLTETHQEALAKWQDKHWRNGCFDVPQYVSIHPVEIVK